VLDSSVLVPFWSRFALQRLAAREQPAIVPVWSEWIVAETWRVLTWRWLASSPGISPDDWRRLSNTANDMMRHLLPVMHHTSLRSYSGPEPWSTVLDPNDIPIWDTATAAGAQYVVSHNTSDFPPLTDGRHVWQGVEYLTAIEFIQDFLGADINDLVPGPIAPAALVRSGRTR
jgi:hypothetical protein